MADLTGWDRAFAEAILMIDALGVVQTWSDEAERLFGWPEAEIVGHTVRQLMPAPCGDDYVSWIGRIQADEALRRAGWRREIPGQRRDGTRFPMELLTVSVPGGNSGGLACIARDLSARNRLESELRATRASAEVAALKAAQYLTHVSHELRERMTAILGFTEYLTDPLLQESERRRVSEFIVENGHRLLDVFGNVMRLCKMESGQLKVHRETCSPLLLLAALQAGWESRAAAKGLTFTLAFDGPVPETVETDPRRLEQILVKLVGNALRATDRGEVRLTLRTRHDAGGRLLLEFAVADTGPGFTPEQAVRLFQPFNAANSARVAGLQGTGLGLTVSRRLARMLGGDLRVESEPGLGSVFRLSLDAGDAETSRLIDQPWEAGEVRAGTAASRAEVQLAGRVLLVKGDADVQNLLAMWLERAGADIEIVQDRTAAVTVAMGELAAGRPFDALVVGVEFPGGESLRLVQQLRAAGLAQPIVAVGGRGTAAERDEALEAGCDEVVPLPARRESLLESVHRVLCRSDEAQSLQERAQVWEQDFCDAGELEPLPRGVIQRPRVLLVEASAYLRKVMVRSLKPRLLLTEAGSQVEAISKALSRPPDAAILDLHLPANGSLATLQVFREQSSLKRIPVLGLLDEPREELEVAARCAGATTLLVRSTLRTEPGQLRKAVVRRLFQLLAPQEGLAARRPRD